MKIVELNSYTLTVSLKKERELIFYVAAKDLTECEIVFSNSLFGKKGWKIKQATCTGYFLLGVKE